MKKIFGRTCLFLLASAFLFENAGFLTHELNLAIGLIFVAALVISYFPIKRENAAFVPILLGIVLMVAAVAVMPGEFLRPGALALLLLGLGLMLRGFGHRPAELPLFAITAAGYGFFLFLYRTDPNIWAWVNDLSLGFSRLVAWLTAWLPGEKALVGPAFLCAGTVVTFALVFIVGAFLLKENRLKKVGKALGGMAVLTAIYLVIFSYLPSALTWELKVGPVPSEAEESQVRQAEEAHRELTTRLDSEKATKVIFSSGSLIHNRCPLWAPFLLVLFFLIPTYFFFKGAELRAVPVFGSIPFAAGGVALVILMGILDTSALSVLSREKRQEAVSRKRVGLYCHGFSNWMRPNFQNFGSRSSGMFGNLPDFLESMGFDQPRPDTRDQAGYARAGVLLTEITEETLGGIDILMLLNVDDMLNCEEPPQWAVPSVVQKARQAELARCATPQGRIDLMQGWHNEARELIWKFVAQGGSLLVIGDHTFLKKVELPDGTVKTRLWLNDILEPFGVQFVNDSAKYFIGGWLHSFENPLHALTWGIRDDQNEVGIVTGASVTASGAARPVIVGKYGFLDAGDEREGSRGYLGNMDYDVGEPLGQTILAAEQDYGKGKVLVFGDTSAFANGIITNTGGFCNRVFTWLAAEGSDRSQPRRLSTAAFDPHGVSAGTGAATTVLALVLLVGACVCLQKAGGHAGIVAAALAVGLVVAAHPRDCSVPLGRGKHGGIRLAYVDNCHMPKISKEGWRDDGLMGLHLNLMRNNFYTQNLKSFDLETLKGADLVVIAAPSVPFSRSDVRATKEYVEGGGTVILTAGHEDVAAAQPLLDAFDLKIPYTPLGRFKYPVPTADRKYAPFWRVWPIEYTADDEEHEGNEAAVIQDDNGEQPTDKESGKKAFEAIMPYEPVRGNEACVVYVDNRLEVASPEQGVRPGAASIDEMAAELRAKIAADSQLKGRVSVNEQDGSLELTGEVATHQVRQKATYLAATVIEREKIINRTQLSKQAADWAGNKGDHDAARELRAKLLEDRELRTQNINVEVENRVAKLTGRVSNSALRKKATDLAETVSYAYNLGVRRNHGRGSFIVIGDSGFWMNKNLEVEKMHEMSPQQKENYVHNIQFMKWVLETYVPKREESR